MQRIKQLVEKQILLNKFRKPVWKENTFKHGIDWSEARRLFGVDDVEQFALKRLKHSLARLASNDAPELVKQQHVGAVGVVAHEDIEASSLVAIYPGVTFTPVDLMTILAFENLFDDVKWIWSFKSSIQQHAQQPVQQTAEQQQQQQQQHNDSRQRHHSHGKIPHHTSPIVNPHAPRSVAIHDLLITRPDGVVIDASECGDLVARFVNPLAVAHRIRSSHDAEQQNVVALPIDVDVRHELTERQQPFLPNVTYPFSAKDILSPAENIYQTIIKQSNSTVVFPQPTLLYFASRKIAKHEELVVYRPPPPKDEEDEQGAKTKNTSK